MYVLKVLRLQKSIEFPGPTHILFGKICKLKHMLAGAETCLKLNITTFFSPSRFGVRIGDCVRTNCTQKKCSSMFKNWS